jgi:hypothetical protein
LTTVHWSAHDEWTTFQSGATFHHRRWDGSAVVERSVRAMQEDKRWLFFQSGPPLPEEDVGGYEVRRKRDRLNEARVAELLARLGASPWSEEFYALPEKRCFVLRRVQAPPSAIHKRPSEVLSRGRRDR